MKLIFVLVAIIAITNGQPVHPNKIVGNTEYYLANITSLSNANITCNYYNNGTSPRNCSVICNADQGCFDAYIDCADSPYCYMDCQYSESCIAATMDGRSAKYMHLYCFSNAETGMFPCINIDVFGPQNIVNSTSYILCRGEQGCYNAWFDVGLSTYSYISVSYTHLTLPTICSV